MALLENRKKEALPVEVIFELVPESQQGTGQEKLSEEKPLKKRSHDYKAFV